MKKLPKTDSVFQSYEEYLSFYTSKEGNNERKGTKYYQIGKEVAQMASESMATIRTEGVKV